MRALERRLRACFELKAAGRLGPRDLLGCRASAENSNLRSGPPAQEFLLQAQECRERALECASKAAEATKPTLRSTFAELAQQWARIVEPNKY
jgi:hypothetical protein